MCISRVPNSLSRCSISLPRNGAGSTAAWFRRGRHFLSGHGAIRGRDRRGSGQFLSAVGAALVFLIDWNKARKLLRSWVAKDDAVRILEWAAQHRIGHRGFL